jgi:hypothetical protein
LLQNVPGAIRGRFKQSLITGKENEMTPEHLKGLNGACETVRVVAPKSAENPSGFIVINSHDFVEGVHERFLTDEERAEKAKAEGDAKAAAEAAEKAAAESAAKKK